MSIPYIEGLSTKIGRIWKRLSSQYELPLITTVVQQPVGKIRSSLVRPYKEDPLGQAVYKATCEECNEVYIIETGLELETRASHHKWDKKSAI